MSANTNYLNATTGLKSWLYTLDHKRIGVMYLVSVMAFFMVGGLLAILLRLELFTPAGDLFSPDLYNRIFTLHGAVMIFLFILPAIPAALGNILLPIMIGAKDVAFPRLNLASWYVFLVGALVAVYSILIGGVDTGWTFYAPYSTDSTTAVTTIVFAAFIMGFSGIFTGINFIATIHKLRAPGMTWYKLPLFVWGLYATAIIQILATPVLAITLLLIIMERLVGVGIFDPALGGDPVLFQHFFWFYSHPAVYIMILPGMGIISELISTFSHKRIFGYKAIAFSSLGIAFVSFLVWGHHMYTAGQSEYASMIFSLITFSVGIPSGIKIFNWMATMYNGRITFQAPMLYAFMFLILFSIGGLTGMFLGALATDIHLHSTYFIVAHFHATMMGGTVIAFLGGVHYWWPKIWGRMYPQKLAQVTAVMVFLGFLGTFLPQFIAGSQGMVRRIHSYPEKFEFLNQISTFSAMILGLSFLVMMVYLFRSIKHGEPASDNPWGGLTMEWETQSPPVEHNFEKDPVVEHGPYDYHEVVKQSTDRS